MRAILILVAVVAGALGSAVPAVADVGLPRGILPVPGAVIAGFAPPADRWDSGHRGVDLAAAPGLVVVAAAAGTVTFAGELAGRGVVAIDHGTVRTTYEPVDPTVAVGDHVSAGTPIGLVGYGGHCSGTCLHWGMRSGDAYLDPRLLLGLPIRLMSADEPVAVPPFGVGSAGGLLRPASGPVSSPFGWRVHPVLGTLRFHDGTDFAAACGEPIVAAAGGVVIWSGFDAAYGNRLLIDHGAFLDGRRMVTSYNHAESYDVTVGQAVAQGERLGSVGTTGWSTGCHLHFSVWLDDTPTDPESLL